MNLESMYRKELLDLYVERPNYGKLISKTNEISKKNPVCDDDLHIELELRDRKIIDAKFTGTACLIGTVSTCILMENLKGMKIKEVLKLTKKDMDKFTGVDIVKTRAGCQLLALDAVKELLKNECS